MARKAAVMEPPDKAPAKSAGLPEQDGNVNIWPILADREKAAEEIAVGLHDGYIRTLEHVAKSQSMAGVLAACWARIEHLES